MDNMILIVDDDEQTLILLRQVLKPFGMEILQANDGQQAIDLLEQHTPSIMLLDMLMPHVPGIEVLEYVAQTPRLDKMYITIISAHKMFAYKDQVTRADNYLVKPIRPKDIREVIQAALDRQLAS
jgi:CheY-like chemotaxis protein